MTRDYYADLGLAKNATPDVIKKAYRKLAMKHHPDRNPGHEAQAEAEFKRAKEAYEILSDDAKRAQFDRYGASDDLNKPSSSHNRNRSAGGASYFQDNYPNNGGYSSTPKFMDDLVSTFNAYATKISQLDEQIKDAQMAYKKAYGGGLKSIFCFFARQEKDPRQKTTHIDLNYERKKSLKELQGEEFRRFCFGMSVYFDLCIDRHEKDFLSCNGQMGTFDISSTQAMILKQMKFIDESLDVIKGVSKSCWSHYKY